MLNFADVTSIQIPEGIARIISVNGKDLWGVSTPTSKINYVSFGDSISAGHFINDAWYDAPYYGGETQFGVNGNTETLIVKNCYVDLIHKKLQNVYGESNVKATSFSRSGSRLKMTDDDFNPDAAIQYQSMIDLISFNEDGDANYPHVIQAVQEADLITICIGANDVLEPAINYVTPYVSGEKNLSELEAIVEENAIRLAGDGEMASYKSLLNKLKGLVKPTAKVVFTTVYNPLKYLYCETGTPGNDYMDSILGVWLDTILGDVPIISNVIKGGLLNSSTVQQFYTRINELSAWAEHYLEGSGTSKYYVQRNADGTIDKDSNGKAIITLKEYEQGKAPKWKGLNQVIRDSLADFNDDNFILAETHEIFDTVPDRQGAGELHYNDLVNCQITKGYDVNDLPWENLWGDGSGDEPSKQMTRYWTNLINKYGTDTEGLAGELIPAIVAKVLYPCLDVHPRADGHYLMYRVFADTLGATLGRESLNTITYNANNGTGNTVQQKVLDKSIVDNITKNICSLTKPNAFATPVGHEGFYEWNKAADGSSAKYSNGQQIYVTSDMTLYAQWSPKTLTLTVRQADKSGATLNSGKFSTRKLYINKAEQTLKETANSLVASTEKLTVAYGSEITFWVKKYLQNPNCTVYIYTNTAEDGVAVKSGTELTGTFKMPDNDVRIEFWSYKNLAGESWWDVYIAGIKTSDLT